MTQKPKGTASITALRVTQWLPNWDEVEYDPKQHRRRPSPVFYLASMPASRLLALAGIQRRSTAGGKRRAADLGIQRRHEPWRSDLILDFVQFGFPWSELSERKRQSATFRDLRKPGWLPTSIVVNILGSQDVRNGMKVATKDQVSVNDSGRGAVTITLPDGSDTNGWAPEALPPIEVIDGQHRLLAFDKGKIADFELPVVLFTGLDVSWQAYLFYTINITPKRINPSLAFDLYPLLRTEDWLEKFEGHPVYREARSQELTEALWAHESSPWQFLINMLGEKGLEFPMVRQAGWIRSLMATYVRNWEGPRIKVGGLFGAPAGEHEEVLPWSRAQQAAFLILVGNELKDAVARSDATWVKELRRQKQPALFGGRDLAFYGETSLLSTDQGIRGLLHVTNDLCFGDSDRLRLAGWTEGADASASDDQSITNALRSLKQEPVARFIRGITESLAEYDWRTSSAKGLSDEQRLSKAAFRGSGGYRELRLQLLMHLSRVATRTIRSAANRVLDVVR